MHYILYKTTNKLNGKCYIGTHQTNKIDDGYIGCGVSSEVTAMGINERINSPFAKAVHKYGYDNFSREILCFCPSREYALMLESLYVDQEFIQRIEVYNARKGGLMPPETARDFILESPDGEIIKVTNLTKFCLNNNLALRTMYTSLYKKTIAKGWKCKYAHDPVCFSTYTNKEKPPPMKGVTGCKSVYVINKVDNTSFRFPSLTKAAKTLGLDVSGLAKALKSNGQVKGWIPVACKDLW